MNFATSTSVDLTQAEKDLTVNFQEFPVKTHGQNLKRKSIFAQSSAGNDGLLLGVVGVNHPTLKYTEIMGYIVNELEKTGIAYKLRESVLQRSGVSMYQEYILDAPILGPDGSSLCPMLIVKASVIEVPLQLIAGTFRFVCENGVVTGEIVDKIRIVGNAGNDILRTSITGPLHTMVTDLQTKVKAAYAGLLTEPIKPYLFPILASIYLSAKVRRNILAEATTKNLITVSKDKPKIVDFEDATSWVHLTGNGSAWDLYNIMTKVATHSINNADSRLYHYNKISQVFGI